LWREGKREENPVPYDAIGTFTNDIQQLVVSANGKVTHAGVRDVFHMRGTTVGLRELDWLRRLSSLIIV